MKQQIQKAAPTITVLCERLALVALTFAFVQFAPQSVSGDKFPIYNENGKPVGEADHFSFGKFKQTTYLKLHGKNDDEGKWVEIVWTSDKWERGKTSDKSHYTVKIRTNSEKPISLYSLGIQNRVADVELAVKDENDAVQLYKTWKDGYILEKLGKGEQSKRSTIKRCSRHGWVLSKRRAPKEKSIWFIKLLTIEKNDGLVAEKVWEADLDVVSQRIMHAKTESEVHDLEAFRDHDNTPPQPLSGGQN